jgi:Fe-S-cluster-containing hydrogenase component 2
MSGMDNHPTVLAVRSVAPSAPTDTLSAGWLRQLCIAAGADDVGFVSIERAELDDQRADILKFFRPAQTLISIVCRMNREPIRSTARSVANLELHHTTDKINTISQAIVRQLESTGLRAINATAGFPMEMDRFPNKAWVVSHKPVAVAAGLGHMGIHRNVIHPKFGNFIILGTVLVAARIDCESVPIDYNPCLTCKLCVSACPVGAIKADGRFDPAACLTHNYREFMHGFTDWVEQVADSRDAEDYRHRVTDQESASLWQSLSFGANYKAAYCVAVCPAGEDVIPPFLQDRAGWLTDMLKPLQQKEEVVYVVPESDAEEYVARRFPHKKAKRVHGVRPSTIAGFLGGLKIVFQEGQSKNLDAVYHFQFTGEVQLQSTVTIRNQTVDVQPGLIGKADCSVVADSTTWMGFVRREQNIIWALLCRKIRVDEPLSLLKAFGKCFPS